MAPFLLLRHAARQAALLCVGFNLKESPLLGILFLCTLLRVNQDNRSTSF